jgi:hypothetical protein
LVENKESTLSFQDLLCGFLLVKSGLISGKNRIRFDELILLFLSFLNEKRKSFNEKVEPIAVNKVIEANIYLYATFRLLKEDEHADILEIKNCIRP